MSIVLSLSHVPSSNPNPYPFSYLIPTSVTPFLHTFDSDVLGEISSFLNPADLTTLIYGCSRYLQKYFQENGEESMWRAQLIRDFLSFHKKYHPPPSDMLSSCVSSSSKSDGDNGDDGDGSGSQRSDDKGPLHAHIRGRASDPPLPLSVANPSRFSFGDER